VQGKKKRKKRRGGSAMGKGRGDQLIFTAESVGRGYESSGKNADQPCRKEESPNKTLAPRGKRSNRVTSRINLHCEKQGQNDSPGGCGKQNILSDVE